MFRQLLKIKKVTQTDLAQHLGVSQQTVSLWVCKKSSPKVDMLPKLAELLKVDVSELVKCFSHAESGEE